LLVNKAHSGVLYIFKRGGAPNRHGALSNLLAFLTGLVKLN